MNILVTGSTPMQAGSERRQLNVSSFPSYLTRALRKLGHEVTHGRPDQVGSVGEYDLVLMGLTAPTSVAARYTFHALWAFREAERLGVPMLVMLDDWQVKQNARQFRNIARSPSHLRRRGNLGGVPPYMREFMEAHFDELIETCDRLGSREWPGVLAPLFPWGDPSKLIPREVPNIHTVFALDPSGMVESHAVTPVHPRDRSREWVLARLNKTCDGWAEKMVGSWPLRKYGNKLLGEPRVNESQITQLYAESWGVIATKYDIAGSGWWRNRYNFSARAEAILVSDPADNVVMGKPYQISCREVEELSTSELDRLGLEQATWFYEHTWSAEQFIFALDEVVARKV